MYTKYILKGLATGVLALATLASCNTNIEALEIIKPEVKSEQYYADLRAYKQRTDHEVFFGWFGGWNTKSPNMRGSLKSVPDSVDIISIWSGTYDREDMEYVQNVKGTRVTFTIFAHKIPQNFLEGENHDQVTREAIERYAMALIDTMNTYGYQGIDLDYEPGYQDPAGGPFTGPLVGPTNVYPNYRDNMEIFVKKLGEFIGPKSGTDKLLIIDGVPYDVKPELAEYFNYGVVQAYNSRSYYDLQNRFNRPHVDGNPNNTSLPKLSKAEWLPMAVLVTCSKMAKRAFLLFLAWLVSYPNTMVRKPHERADAELITWRTITTTRPTISLPARLYKLCKNITTTPTPLNPKKGTQQ